MPFFRCTFNSAPAAAAEPGEATTVGQVLRCSGVGLRSGSSQPFERSWPVMDEMGTEGSGL